ncbi:MAG: hypothetical protein AAFX02_05845 [Pseudomonadota bacterium]
MPAQIRNSDLATPAVDLYSLSKIFYELLIGVLPTGHWQPPSGSRADVPVAIDTLIEKGLKDAPIARPQSAAEYRDDLYAALNDVKPIIRPGKLPKWVTYAAGGVAAVMGLVVVAMNITPDPDTILREDIDRNADIVRRQIEADDRAAQLEFERAEAERIAREQAEFERAERARLERERLAEEQRERERRDRERRERNTVSFSNYSGTWYDGYGGYYNLGVQSNGSFQGSGFLMDGTPVTMSGSFSGNQMDYTIYLLGQAYVGGTASKNGPCHYDFVSTRFIDSARVSGQYHMNHFPGAPCP